MSNRPTGMTYDVASVLKGGLPRQHIMPQEVVATLIGTYAAVTAIVDLFVVPANSNIKITGASCKKLVGGTATGTASHWGLAQSLVGTGEDVVFGTLLFGTHANNTYHNFSVTATDVPAGNVVRLVGLVGTTVKRAKR